MMKMETIRKVMSEMGRKGGKKGGPARAASLTPQRRLEIARNASAAAAIANRAYAADRRRTRKRCSRLNGTGPGQCQARSRASPHGPRPSARRGRRENLRKDDKLRGVPLLE
jgi:hypothetical protein